MQYSPMFQKICTLRDVDDRFLNPQYTDLSDPFTMNDMPQAVEQIITAIKNNTMVAIYADYDADGIPGSVVLADFFRLISFTNYVVYIPHRHKEGYGLHISAIDKLAEQGVGLFITIDLGITAVREIAYAQSLGLKIIVTDHHEPDSVLPDSLLVHPKLGNYADPMLCGCAVVFQLVRAIAVRLRETDPIYVIALPIGFEKWLLDMVGLSTLADMVPLQNENRILSYYGMKVLRKSRRIGLQALANVSRISLSTIDETGIGFRIVPYINAASRMAHPELAYQLLSATDLSTAAQLASVLSGHNTARKSAVDKIMKTAVQIAIAQNESPILWVGDPDWNVGVLSIIAGRLCEQFNKPVFVWTHHENEYIKGSARCGQGFSVTDFFQSAPIGIFERSGGHTFAGGFTMNRDSVPAFFTHSEQYMSTVDKNQNTDDLSAPPENYDIILSLQDCNEIFMAELDLLRPFGVGNVAPVFKFVNIRPVERKMFGKTSSHEKIIVTDDSGVMRSILLFSGDRTKCEHWEIGKAYNICAQIEISGEGRWREIVLKLT